MVLQTRNVLKLHLQSGRHGSSAKWLRSVPEPGQTLKATRHPGYPGLASTDPGGASAPRCVLPGLKKCLAMMGSSSSSAVPVPTLPGKMGVACSSLLYTHMTAMVMSSF